MSELKRIEGLIRDVINFPKQGILFKDISPLLGDAAAMAYIIECMAEKCPKDVAYIAGMESRGFIFGSLLAAKLGCGFIPLRKKGKLPYNTESVRYGLEYGEDQLEIHIDACSAGSKVLICDDLIATGGTAKAAELLLKRIGAEVVGYTFVIELQDLEGRRKLQRGIEIESIFTF